jgi:hypothetical protein
MVLSIQNRYCIYTVLHSVLKQKCGLELETEYSAVHGDYPYVFIRIVHGTRRICTQCTVREWPGVGAGMLRPTL